MLLRPVESAVGSARSLEVRPVIRIGSADVPRRVPGLGRAAVVLVAAYRTPGDGSSGRSGRRPRMSLTCLKPPSPLDRRLCSERSQLPAADEFTLCGDKQTFGQAN